MRNITWVKCAALIISVLVNVLGSHGGKILVFPVDGSHWINMNLLIEGLHARHHNITVVRSVSSWYVKEKCPHYTSITVHLPEVISIEDQDFFVSFLSRIMEIQRGGASVLAFISFYWEMLTKLSNMHRQASQLAVEMFKNQQLMQSLQDTQFDLVLMDPGLPAGLLIAHKLHLPTVFNVRWITSGEGHFIVAPSPVSYVPTSLCTVSDKMIFTQRAKNMFHYFLNICIDTFVVCPHYNRLCAQYFGPDINFYHLLQSIDVWLMRVDFVFEFPRPTMPNIVYIGGFQCKPSKALPPDLEEFVQSSGDHGVVIMSLGTLVKGLPVGITSEIAAAFAQIPQKVIWRHLGEKPQNLGNNTLLVQWLPQNDLLGHPKVKAFVAHGGTNGIYEAIYHSIPVLGLPLLFDQFENVLRLEVRGAAKVLDVTKITSQGFLQALQDVLQDPSYQSNMQKLSRLHRDKPLPPLDSAFFWIEFVMRHKGAAHLRTESYKMPWYAYHSLDVIGFLIVAVLAVLATVATMFHLLCCRLCRRRKLKQE
ncbi:UDP-glucuronosyltransferase 2A1-like [Conger conger]|uniref:UDP-glucuronosyltransferase 2A1-like n=1 Tax=Conger conger TaxID=82655 RepID=UPI002A59BC09|nr:UDP-glucuronosyltransferase 2A1-like [Conger conger]